MSNSPQNPPPAESLIGRVLKGAYRLDSKLGEGGMGAVFTATQLAVDRQVAVKVLRTQVMQDPEMAKQMQARFMREAKLTSKLEHPNTVRLIDFGETDEDKMLFLVLELLRGAELSRVMQKEAPLSPARVAKIGRQMCQSLSEAHAQGIIHRDLKPDNVFLCEYHGVKDHVKIVDFGIARIVGGEFEETSQLTATGLIIGTPKYMAPEQVQAQPITAQTDLYALGVMLYEMLLGKAPFHADSVMALAFKHVHDEPEPLPDSFGHGWQSIITQLMAKHPAARPTNADVVASILGSLEHGDGIAVDIGTGLGGSPASQQTMGDAEGLKPRKKGLMMAIAAGLLVGLGTVAAIVAGGGDDKAPKAEVKAAAAVAKDKSEKQEPPEKLDESEKSDPAAEKVPEKPPEPAAAAKTEPAPAAVPAPPAKVKLTIRSRPSGAKVVRADGSELCTTLCEVEVDPTGQEEQLTLKLAGYQDFPMTVRLEAGGVISNTEVLTATPVPAAVPVARTKSNPRASRNKGKKKADKKKDKVNKPDPKPKKPSLGPIIRNK